MADDDHSFSIEFEGGARVGVCSCGWRSRKTKTLDGPSDAWMNHLDKELPRV